MEKDMETVDMDTYRDDPNTQISYQIIYVILRSFGSSFCSNSTRNLGLQYWQSFSLLHKCGESLCPVSGLCTVCTLIDLP